MIYIHRMLTNDEKEYILSEFPKIKLSYENIIHNKVNDFDYIIAIPEGKKCFAWFTHFNDNMVCFLLELENNKKQIKNIKIINSCFSSSLCYGTIFYGTLFYHMNNPLFSIEDIFMYKGKDIYNNDFNYKLEKISYILNNKLKQVAYNNYMVVFGLSLISKSYEDFNVKLSNIKYKLASIKYINLKNKNSFLTIPFDTYNSELSNQKPLKDTSIKDNSIKDYSSTNNLQKPERNTRINTNNNNINIFMVKPDIQNDIYYLYTLDNNYVGLAAIPDYKTSVMMNKLFRIIKENDDLDALEESDDEEEFENSNIDKFVNLEKSYKMVCVFNNKFKKWVPTKILE